MALLARFEDKDHGAFFASQSSADLILRLKDDYDGAEPAANTLAIEFLQALAATLPEPAFAEPAQDALEALSARLAQHPSTLPRLVSALLRSAAPPSSITFQGNSLPLVAEFHRHFRPFTSVHAEAGLQTAAVVCEDLVCQPPAATEGALAQLLA